MKARLSGVAQGQIRFQLFDRNVVTAIVALASAVLFPCPGFGQSWTCGSGACTTTGNVGVGRTAPTGPIDVLGTGSAVFTRDVGTSNLVTVQAAVQVGITNTGSATVGYGPSVLGFANNSSAAKSNMGRVNFVWDNSTAGAEAGAITFAVRANSADALATTERMRISSGGNVGIGTASPQHLLSVAGTIGALEVVVVSSGADYVFDQGYRLTPLSEVADYIKANHHLPEIPSAQEVGEKGVSLGEMQTKLLAKIEELTLHMIRTEKDNRELRERVARLELDPTGRAN